MHQLPQTSSITCCKCALDGLMAVAILDPPTINLYSNQNTTTFILDSQLSPLPSPVSSIAIAPQLLLSGCVSGNLRLWDLSPNSALQMTSSSSTKSSYSSFAKRDSKISGAVFHPYTEFFAVSHGSSVSIFDTRHKFPLQHFSLQSTISSIQFSPDGRWIVAASSGSHFGIWDLPSGSFVWSHTDSSSQSNDASCCSAVFDPVDLKLYYSTMSDIYNLDLETWASTPSNLSFIQSRDSKTCLKLLTFGDNETLVLIRDCAISLVSGRVLCQDQLLFDSQVFSLSGNRLLVAKIVHSVLYFDILAIDTVNNDIAKDSINKSFEALHVSTSIGAKRKSHNQTLASSKPPWNDKFQSDQDISLPVGMASTNTDDSSSAVQSLSASSSDFITSLNLIHQNIMGIYAFFNAQSNFTGLFSYLLAQNDPILLRNVLPLLENTRYQTLDTFAISTQCMQILLQTDPLQSCEFLSSYLHSFKGLILDSLRDDDVSHAERFTLVEKFANLYYRRKKSEIIVKALKEFRLTMNSLPISKGNWSAVSNFRMELDQALRDFSQ